MSTHYTVGGMPLAFTQEDFLVLTVISPHYSDEIQMVWKEKMYIFHRVFCSLQLCWTFHKLRFQKMMVFPKGAIITVRNGLVPRQS